MKRFDGEIRDLSQAGLGVVNGPDGCVYFVQGTWPGDVGTFEILSQKKRYGFAKLLTLTTPSPHRVPERLCAHHGYENGDCGGCPWLPFSYSDQLVRKDQLVRYALERAKVLGPRTKLLPIAGSPQSLGYRNRAQFKTNGQQLGFVSFQSKTLVDIKSCPVLAPACAERLSDLREQLPNAAWQPRRNYLWNFIEINDVSAWDKNQVGLNQRLPFLQGNHAQNLRMQTWIREAVATLPSPQNVLELFCGSGNFTTLLATASNVQNVVAAEGSPEAIAELNARNLPNTQTLAADLYNPASWSRLKQMTPQATLVFLDPPREGFEGIDQFLKRFPDLTHIIYVSCSLNTFSRDAVHLNAAGFMAEQIQPVDMFPNTQHIELCSLFSRG